MPDHVIVNNAATADLKPLVLVRPACVSHCEI